MSLLLYANSRTSISMTIDALKVNLISHLIYEHTVAPLHDDDPSPQVGSVLYLLTGLVGLGTTHNSVYLKR